MPVFTHTAFGDRNLTIDTDACTAKLGVTVYNQPSTIEDETGEYSLKPIQPSLFATIDFSRLEDCRLIRDESCLVVRPAGWTWVFFTKLA